MAEMTDNLRGFWSGMDRPARIGLVAGVAMIVLLVIALGWWLLKRDYQVLFANLEQRDAAAIVEELKRLKIPYRLEGDGATIRVPAEQVHETRLGLMSRGVSLSGGVGFEIFDKQEMGMSDYTQRVNYQRALQGELARTIQSIQDVRQARVHLVLPEASLFKRERNRSKGSVSLVLKRGGQLSPEQIVGIQRLVAAAVPGLDGPMVTIVDQRGVSLTPPADGDTGVALGSGQLRLKREVEQYLARKAAEVLDRAFGPGQALVSVDATLDFDEVKRTVQEVLPARPGSAEGGVVVRKRDVMQKETRALPATDGQVEASAADRAQTLNTTSEVDYEVGRRMEQLVKSPGGVRRISVGVLVPKALDADQTARLRALVTMAVGLDESRGDGVAVHAVDQLVLSEPRAAAAAPESAPAELAEPPRSAPAPSMIWGAGRLSNAPLVWALAVAILGILVGAVLLKGRRRAAIDSDEARRQALLAEIRGWLAEDQAKAGGGAQP
jgi:flagellar M-ring protein FliF